MKNFTQMLFVCFLISLASCDKEAENSPSTETVVGDLTDGQADAIDGLTTATGFNSSTVVLPNGLTVENYLLEVDPAFFNLYNRSTAITGTGTEIYSGLGPQDAKNALIAQLTHKAMNLMDDTNHQYTDPVTNKVQNGLVYSWGSKDPTVQQAPPGLGSTCTEKVYGLDCSGFVQSVFQAAGINLPGDARTQHNKDNVLRAIKVAIPAFEKVKVEDLGRLDTSQLKAGDIIYWDMLPERDKITKQWKSTSGSHIGIVLSLPNGKLAIAQSNGTPGINSNECDKNLMPNRGPHPLDLNNNYFFKPQARYTVTRINADLSGQWRYDMRCVWATTDALQLPLTFPTSANNTFTASATARDYDGSVLTCSFVFNYDEATSTLNGEATILDDGTDKRVDRFSFPLLRDHTSSYTATTRVVVNSGCPVSVRLVNLE